MVDRVFVGELQLGASHHGNRGGIHARDPERYHRGPGARGRTTAGRQGKREEQDCFVHRFLRSKGTSGRDDDLAGHLLVAAAAEDGAVEIVGPALSGKIRTCVTLPGSTVSSILRSGTWK